MASVKLFTLCHIADVKIEYSVSLLFSASGTNPTVEYYPTWWRLDDQDMEHNKADVWLTWWRSSLIQPCKDVTLTSLVNAEKSESLFKLFIFPLLLLSTTIWV